MKLTPCICKCCGGRINIAKMKCEYCDTYYVGNSSEMKLEQSITNLKNESLRIKQSYVLEELYLDAIAAMRKYADNL